MAKFCIANIIASDSPWSLYFLSELFSTGCSRFPGFCRQYARHDPEPPLTVYRLDVASGRRELWKRFAPPDLTGFLRYGPRIRGVGYAVTPDGRAYAYTYFTDQSRLTLIEGPREWWK